jgi:hypothetical protein
MTAILPEKMPDFLSIHFGEHLFVNPNFGLNFGLNFGNDYRRKFSENTRTISIDKRQPESIKKRLYQSQNSAADHNP